MAASEGFKSFHNLGMLSNMSFFKYVVSVEGLVVFAIAMSLVVLVQTSILFSVISQLKRNNNLK